MLGVARTWEPLLFICCLFCSLTPVSSTCYWANSTRAQDDPYSIATDDTACFPEQFNSPCCGTGWSCLSDGVCYIEQEGIGFYYRGTCTDRTWNSQQCPGWCFAQNSNTSIPLIKCQKMTGEDWYCCPGDSDCDCQTGKFAVKLGPSQPTTLTVIGSTSWPGISGTTINSINTGFASLATSTITSIGIICSTAITATASNTVTTSATGAVTYLSTSSTSSLAAAVVAIATSTSPLPSSSSNTSSDSSSTRPTNTTLAAGLGAGLGGAVILVTASAWYWLAVIRPRKRQGRITTLHERENTSTEDLHNTHTGSGDRSPFHNEPKELPPDQYSGYGTRTELYGHEPFPKRVVGVSEIDTTGPGRRIERIVGRIELAG